MRSNDLALKRTLVILLTSSTSFLNPFAWCYGVPYRELGDYLNALAWNTQLVASFYTFDSVLRSEEHSSLFLGLVDTLSSLNFNLPVDDERYDVAQSKNLRISAWSVISLTPSLDTATILSGRDWLPRSEYARGSRIICVV